MVIEISSCFGYFDLNIQEELITKDNLGKKSIDFTQTNEKGKNIIYVPFISVNGTGVIKCIKINKIIIDKKTYKNIYLGLSNDKFHLHDADIILNVNLWEDEDEKNNRTTDIKTKAVKRK